MALTLSRYRFGIHELAESTHGWLAAENFGIQWAPGRPFLLRFNVQADATGLTNVDNEFQFRQTRAGAVIVDWTNITTSSAVVRTGATSVFANTANCTKRLGGTGTFEASANGCTTDGISGGANNDIVANGCSETEIPLQIINADTAIGDIIEFRLTRDGGVLLNTYAVLGQLRVAAEIAAVQSRNNSLHTSITASANKIASTQVSVGCVGMSAADLADNTLSIEMDVRGTNVVGSTDPADYTVHLYGPDIWVGGQTGKANTKYAGMSIPPGFAFAGNVPIDVERVLATFQPNKTATFGADATLVELP